MGEHFAHNRIDEIADAVLAVPVLYDGPTRALFMAGIRPDFLGSMIIGLPPRFQLFGDLKRLNEVERLSDGAVPLLTWLKNAAFLSKGTLSEKIFLSAIDDVQHLVSGEPRLSEPHKLPEYKEKIIHRDDMVSFTFMSEGLKAASAVAKLMVTRYEGERPKQRAANQPTDFMIYLGTGWLITSSLLVTNYHVVNARNEGEPPADKKDLLLQAKATKAIFDFNDSGLLGKEDRVLELEAFDVSLDYAVLRLAPTNREPLRIASTAPMMRPGDYIPVNIVQHPAGSSKKYAIRNNLISAITATDIRYFTDTKEGSSGSPVLDDGWKVVALHRGSTYVDGVNFQGRSTAWINLGTRIDSIQAHIRGKYALLAAELGL